MNHVETTEVRVKRNRFFGLIILGIIIVPMLLAYVMFHTGWGVSNSTTNKGELIRPALPIANIASINSPTLASILTQQGTAKKWRLLVPVTANCNDACQSNLYVSRQVHIRLAEKAYRVERIILAVETLPNHLEDMLSSDHPNTHRVQSRLDNVYEWLAPANMSKDAENYYYLVDQEGFAMMRYNTAHSGQDLLDDIKKLLKFTYDK